MSYIGSYDMGDSINYRFGTHNADGNVAAITGTATYRMYDTTATAAVSNGSAVITDTANTTAFYRIAHALTTASGFFYDMHYDMRVNAIVGTVTASKTVHFYIKPQSESLTTANINAIILTAIQGTTTTATPVTDSLVDKVHDARTTWYKIAKATASGSVYKSDGTTVIASGSATDSDSTLAWMPK